MRAAQAAGNAWLFDRERLVRYVVGDLMDPMACPGPFDVIIERCCVQLFGDELAGAMERLRDRLSADGLFRSHCHTGSRPCPEQEHPLQRWLDAEKWIIWSGRPAPEPRGRFAWLSASTG